MITLEEYLGRYSKTEFLKTNDPTEYLEFLRTFKVDAKFKKFDIKYGNLFIYGVKYVDFLNNCIEYIIKNNIPNILSNGIKLKVVGFNNMPSDLLFDEITAHYVYLRDFVGWRILFSRIDPRILSDIFIHLKGFYYFKNNYFQVFGAGLNKTVRFPQYLKEGMLLDNSMMFINKKIHKPFNDLAKILSSNLNNLLDEIFEGSHSIDEKRLASLFSIVIKTHQRIKKFYYRSILLKYCGNEFEFNNFQNDCHHQAMHNIFSKSVKLKSILKSLIHVITKLFPIELFGNMNNRRLVFQNIERFVLLKNKIVIQRFFNKARFHLKAISWTNNLTDFLNFIKWLLNVFIAKFLGCIFHITTSTNVPNYYYFFYHEYWNLINQQYMDNHIKQHFFQISDTSDKQIINHKTFPKQNSLRMVCNLHISKSFRFGKVIPVKEILKSFQLQPPNIFEILDHFRNKNKDYYVIKFDIKNCFDSIPITKVYNIIDKFISPNDMFHFNKNNGRLIHNYKDSNSLNQAMNEKLYVYKNGRYLMKFKKSNFDIKTFTKPEIMDIVSKFLNDYVIKVNGELYARSKGIFQGSPLSPVFNCLFLDHLINGITLYENSKVIKYADDFLIISDSEIKSELIFTNFQAILARYDIQININKSEILQRNSKAEFINFCGLIINKDLVITKNYNNLKINLNLNLKNFVIYCYNLSSYRLTFLKKLQNDDNSSFINNFKNILTNAFKIIKQYLNLNNNVNKQKFLLKFFILFRHLAIKKVKYKRKNFLLKIVNESFSKNCAYHFNLNFYIA